MLPNNFFHSNVTYILFSPPPLCQHKILVIFFVKYIMKNILRIISKVAIKYKKTSYFYLGKKILLKRNSVNSNHPDFTYYCNRNLMKRVINNWHLRKLLLDNASECEISCVIRYIYIHICVCVCEMIKFLSLVVSKVSIYKIKKEIGKRIECLLK